MIKDRSHAPERLPIGDVSLPVVKDEFLSNGIPVTIIDSGSQDLCRVEFIFNAGNSSTKHPLLASFANDLLDEGTPKFNAEEIAEQLDFYGAFVETESHFDHASVFVFSLNKHLPSILPVVSEFILNASFPDDDVATYVANQRQRFLVAEEKVNYVCRKKFNEVLFGPEHAYGKNVNLKDYKSVHPADLRHFHQEHYTPENCRIMVAGKRPEGIMDLLEKNFGELWRTADRKKKNTALSTFAPARDKKCFVPKKDALQSAIRIGRVLFNRHHPDFLEMQVVNTILGGYFGSRLMANIREDKGYTYGIASGITSLLHSGTFVISTEVGADVCKNALKEIYFELKKMREILVSDEELDTVKNYMLGTYMSSLDGPFHIADRIRILRQFGLNNEHFDRLVHVIRTITPQRIQELSNIYLKEQDLFEVVVGKK